MPGRAAPVGTSRWSMRVRRRRNALVVAVALIGGGVAAAQPVAQAAAATRTPVSRCAGSQLAITSRKAQGGDGHGGVVVILTNSGTASCFLRGYPRAVALDRAGQPVADAKRTLGGYLARCRCDRPPKIRLAVGASASTTVEGDNAGGAECLRGHSLAVTPPGTQTTTDIAYLDAYTCDLQVHPIIAGSGGGT